MSSDQPSVRPTGTCMPVRRPPTSVDQAGISSFQNDAHGAASIVGFSDVLISCCMETLSERDYRIMRLKLKDSLRPFGLVHLLDQLEVTDTFKLFETVFSDGHSQLPDYEKLVLLEGLMKVTGKHHMADQVRLCYQPYTTSMERANSPHLFHAIHHPRSSHPSRNQARSLNSDLQKAFDLVKERVGRYWRELATALEFTLAEIDEIQEEQAGLSNRCFYMLMKWHMKNGARATIQWLMQALHQIRRTDIAEVLEAAYSATFSGTGTVTRIRSTLGVAHEVQPKESLEFLGEHGLQSIRYQRHKSWQVDCDGATLPQQCTANEHSHTPVLGISSISHTLTPSSLPNEQKKLEVSVSFQPSSSLNPSISQQLQQGTLSQTCTRETSISQGNGDGARAQASKQVTARHQTLSAAIFSHPFLDPAGLWQMMARNCTIRHLTIVAVGRTGVGKTTSINTILGTMTHASNDVQSGKIGHGKSETQYASTWTRSYSCNCTEYKLTFIDTPGLGDNSTGNDSLTDDQVCERICWAIDPIKRDETAHIMMVYFSPAPSTIDAKEVESIKKLEAATGIPLSCVVLTMAGSTFIDASLTWNGSKDQVKESLVNITDEFQSHFIRQHADDDELEGLSGDDRRAALETMVTRKINADANGLPTRKRVQDQFLQILAGRRHLEVKKQWYERVLGRSTKVPVMLLENKESLQSSSCNVEQLYQTWVELLGQKSSLFLLMTSDEVLSDPNSKFSHQEHREAQASVATPLPLPVDDSSSAARQSRNKAQQSIWQKLIEMLKQFFFGLMVKETETSNV